MKKLLNIITRTYHQLLLKIGGWRYSYQSASKKFITSQKVSYEFNNEIAEDYRYYESVGINAVNYGNGKHPLHLMDREQLITSLGHCYATLRHVHGKYIETSMLLTQKNMDNMEDRYDETETCLI